MKINRDTFREICMSRFTQDQVDLVMEAYDASKYAHRNQNRKGPDENGEYRYFNHPRRVAANMLAWGVRDHKAIIVALLHDVCEDTALYGNMMTDGYNQARRDWKFRLTKNYGSDICNAVIALSCPLINSATEFNSKNNCLSFYKKWLAVSSQLAKFGKLGDRLDNISSIENKPKTIALKIKETEDFYIPMFLEAFQVLDSDLAIIGAEKTQELILLVQSKKALIPQ